MIPKDSGQFKSLRTVLVQEGVHLNPTNKTAFSQESATHLQTLFMVYCFPSCSLWILSKLSFWHNEVLYADAGQLDFLVCSAHRFIFLNFLSFILRENKTTRQSISEKDSWCLHVVSMSLRPSQGACKAVDVWQIPIGIPPYNTFQSISVYRHHVDYIALSK